MGRLVFLVALVALLALIAAGAASRAGRAARRGHCAASACAFNAETSCNALAITVAGSDRTPGCGTFVQLDVRRPVTEGASTVGACHRLECTYNVDLACTAKGIEVTDVATCATYTID